MEHIQLFKTDNGYISPYKIRWVKHDPMKQCFEICLKSTGCKTIPDDDNNYDTWSVCKLESKESYNYMFNKVIEKDNK